MAGYELSSGRVQPRRFQAGELRGQIEKVSIRALASGALQPIDTRFHHVEDAGVRFGVRIVTNLARKELERRKRACNDSEPPPDPFLPFDRDLYVSDLTDTHLCLLNKFNVIDRHALIVTRAFQDQDTVLEYADFEALCYCLQELDGLGFYNGGTVAGASERHKHLQIVPLPLIPGTVTIPMGALFDRAGADGRVPGLGFRHGFERLARGPGGPEPGELLERYAAMLARTGVERVLRPAGTCTSVPYNLLVTRCWMLLVPRSAESFESVYVNALGYAGSMFVLHRRQYQAIRDTGPMRILANTAFPWP